MKWKQYTTNFEECGDGEYLARWEAPQGHRGTITGIAIRPVEDSLDSVSAQVRVNDRIQRFDGKLAVRLSETPVHVEIPFWGPLNGDQLRVRAYGAVAALIVHFELGD